MRLSDARTHASVEAIPLDADSFARAPMYFKAEVDSAAGEWGQHHAKRMIDTRDKVWPVACYSSVCPSRHMTHCVRLALLLQPIWQTVLHGARGHMRSPPCMQAMIAHDITGSPALPSSMHHLPAWSADRDKILILQSCCRQAACCYESLSVAVLRGPHQAHLKC